MKEKFRSYKAYQAECDAMFPNSSIVRMYVWTDPGAFAGDVKRLIATTNGKGRDRGYAGQSNVRGAAFLGKAPAPAAQRAPVHEFELSIPGDHAQKKILAHLSEMTAAFTAKKDKGRKGTVMMLDRIQMTKLVVHYAFVLVTSDDLSAPRKRDLMWQPTGDHEAVVWSWPASDTGRLTTDVASIFGI